MEYLSEIIKEFYLILMDASPFMILGLLMAGLLKAFLPEDMIRRYLGGESNQGILRASLLGIPIPLCSCGVVPAAAGIKRQGASKSSVVSFLISTPETGVDSIAITYAMLGPVMAVIRPFAAFVTALSTGFAVSFFGGDKEAEEERKIYSATGITLMEKMPELTPDETFKPFKNNKKKSFYMKLKKGLSFSFLNLTKDIGPWFMAGMLLAAIISAFVTPDLISKIGSENRIVIMGLMLIVSVPLYVCATSSTPIAAAFLMTGVSPGAALVFLLAGPATNAASLSVISRLIGRKSAIIYLVGIIISSLIIGFATDFIFDFLRYKPVPVTGEAVSEPAFILQLASSIVLLFFFIFPYFKDVKNMRFKK